MRTEFLLSQWKGRSPRGPRGVFHVPSSPDFLAIVGKSVSSVSGVGSVVEAIESIEAIVSIVASSSPAVEAEAEPVVSISIEAGVSIIGGESSDPEARHWGEVIRDSLGGEAGQGSRNSLRLGWMYGIDHVGELARHIDIGGGHGPREPKGGEGGVVGVQGRQPGHLVCRGRGLLHLGLSQTRGDNAAHNNQKLHDDDVCDDRLVTLLWGS